MLEGQLSQLSSEVERLFDEARARARRELADQLNQSVRRIRHSRSLDELAATLLDAAWPFAAGAAIFRIAGATLKGEKIRGAAARRRNAFDCPRNSALRRARPGRAPWRAATR
jgi:ABC-type transporter Mla subunit MlaD